MRAITSLAVAIVLVAVLLGVAALMYARTTGLSARPQPSGAEARVARMLRSFAVPNDIKQRRNPVPASDDVLAKGMAHYADHCASCHANDGSGDTELGRGLFPKVPDMRLPATQELTDGELFYIIENGVRFTGMPGWSTGRPAGETSTWHLVHFIRHLPRVTPEELSRMESLNPRSPQQIREEIEEEQFLSGTAAAPQTESSSHTTHDHTGVQP